ncbi:MAG: TIM barrel protein [Pirellulaceae bacterium]
MLNQPFWNRRQMLKLATAGAGACVLGSSNAQPILSAPVQEVSRDWPIAIFEKVFEALSYEELADAVDQIGADGIEATIRPGGHIEPAAAEDEVPKLVEALAARGKRVTIAATAVGKVDDERLLKTLKANGITHYRMVHYRLDNSQPIMPQVKNYAAAARELAALNAELGLQGLYQNHSGGSAKSGYLGALGWDAAMLLDGIAPSALGLALDTRHLRKDTGSSWQTAVAVCKPHVRSIFVKDGMWKGPRGDEYVNTPLDEGFVNQQVFDTIRKGLPPMPLCIHMEWLGYRVFKKDEIPSAIEAHQKDIAVLRKWLAS